MTGSLNDELLGDEMKYEWLIYVWISINAEVHLGMVKVSR